MKRSLWGRAARRGAREVRRQARYVADLLDIRREVQVRRVPPLRREDHQRIIYVPTDRIRLRILGWRRYRVFGRGRFVLGGSWDRYLPEPATPACSLPMRTVRQLFVEGRPVDRCEEYVRMRECLEGGRPFYLRGCETLGEIRAYFDRLVDAFESMREEGYKTQAELGGDADEEIHVCIDREGEPIKTRNGNHRLEMARVLEIPTLPVMVQGVHYLWLQRWTSRAEGDVAVVIDRGLDAFDRGPAAASSVV